MAATNRKHDVRLVVERFIALKDAAAKYGKNPQQWSELDLHDAAVKYARSVIRVARKDRAT